MHPFTDTVITAALFHYPAYGFPSTSNGNGRISKRRTVIRRFLAIVDRWSAEVDS